MLYQDQSRSIPKKAALYTDLQTIDIREVEYVKPEAGYLTIDTKCSGICGSDLHMYFGHRNQLPRSAPGHESSGIVKDVGAEVKGFQPGDRVTFEVWSYCSECVFCRKGLYNLCDNKKWTSDTGHGGFAEFTTIHQSSVFKLPENMSFEEGALVEPLAVCYRALLQAKASFQDRVAIIGGGTIGLFCLAVAKAIGVKETFITVKYEQQANVAKAYGADHIINVGDTNLKAYVAEMTNGLGVDAVIETVASAQGFNDALAIVRKRGRVVLVGGYYEPLTVNLETIVRSEASVTGSNCYAFSGMTNDFEATIELIHAGKIDVGKLVTHRFPLEEISEAFKVAADKTSGSVKVHVVQ